MEGNVFINDAITYAINKYLDNKNFPDGRDFNTFLVIVIRTLVFINGELDIVNPIRVNDVNSFYNNLSKFGLERDIIDDLTKQMLLYYQNENNTEVLRQSFLRIQKILVDMFIKKKTKVSLSDDELKAFKNCLYTKDDINPYKRTLYDKLMLDNNEIINYLNSKLFLMEHNFVFTEYKDIALSKEAYQIAGFNPTEVFNMSEKDIRNVNNKVFHFFRIRDRDLNKRKRVEEAVLYYKKYGNSFMSGNGYVDTLLITSFIATAFMLALLLLINLGG